MPTEYRLISIFKISVTLVSVLFTHHHWSILYPNNSLVRECFYILVQFGPESVNVTSMGEAVSHMKGN